MVVGRVAEAKSKVKQDKGPNGLLDLHKKLVIRIK